MAIAKIGMEERFPYINPLKCSPSELLLLLENRCEEANKIFSQEGFYFWSDGPAENEEIGYPPGVSLCFTFPKQYELEPAPDPIMAFNIGCEGSEVEELALQNFTEKEGFCYFWNVEKLKSNIISEDIDITGS
ncbi:hypothetical protein [Paracoccus onubensis]|uniref:Uncharacterized protein n=1 Tax=Paracoccus onubensis TaxID=1675788 RepID=A0A418SX80_9RHOB|nr:hypothetical protein [Paracoccus onubensis]RJE85488.1 hypothetical protein D3P04_10850 [Paracoccus onubensis]